MGFFSRSVITCASTMPREPWGSPLTVPLDMDLHDLLTKMELADISPTLKELPVLAGGPVSTDRGFVLHSPKPGYHSSLQLTDELMITTSLDVLHTLGTAQAPERFIITLGYAGWEAGQLEQELLDNSWLTPVLTTPELIFNVPWSEKRWLAATQAMGLDIWRVAPGRTRLTHYGVRPL